MQFLQLGHQFKGQILNRVDELARFDDLEDVAQHEEGLLQLRAVLLGANCVSDLLLHINQ